MTQIHVLLSNDFARCLERGKRCYIVAEVGAIVYEEESA